MSPRPTPIADCPPWCAGHDDDQESVPPRWHRGTPVMVAATERPSAFLSRSAGRTLTTTELVVAAEQDERVTYVYIGAVEDVGRFFAVTRDSALLLHEALGAVLESLG